MAIGAPNTRAHMMINVMVARSSIERCIVLPFTKHDASMPSSPVAIAGAGRESDLEGARYEGE